MGTSAKPEEGGSGGAGTGGGSNGGAGGSSGAASTPTTVYVDANVEALSARYGGKDNAIRRLWKDGKKARDGRRIAEEQLEAAQKQLKRDDGSVLLTKEQAAEWNGFVALGKKAAELKTVLTEHGDLSTKLSAQERKNNVATAAKFAKFNESALAEVINDKKLTLVLKTEKIDGKDVDVPYIQPSEAGAAAVKLTDFAKDKLATYLPALTAQSAGGSGTGSGAGGATGDATRTPFIEQTGSSSTSGGTERKGPPLREARVLPSQRNAKKE